MTNNTIHSVPRELLEEVMLAAQRMPVRGPSIRAKLHALLSAPSPAGVDGLEVKRLSIAGVRSLIECRDGELARYSDVERLRAIIDGLRGEVTKINSDRLACWAEFKVMTRACLDAEKERDQQAQRIGELEGLLREERTYASVPSSCQQGIVARCICRNCRLLRIDAALSAGKEGG